MAKLVVALLLPRVDGFRSKAFKAAGERRSSFVNVCVSSMGGLGKGGILASCYVGVQGWAQPAARPLSQWTLT
jgi:hypothetical protein